MKGSGDVVVAVFLLPLFLELPFCHKLNDVILYYEPVVYEGIPMAQMHEKGQTILTFRFHAFARSFDLELATDSDLLASNALIEVHEGNRTHYLSSSHLRQFLVYGRLADDHSSFAQGDIQLGLFDGIITTKEEQYFVEPSSTYFVRPMPFQSIIFRRSDINYTAAACNGDGICRPYSLDEISVPIKKDEATTDSSSTVRLKRNTKLLSNLTSTVESDLVCSLKIVADHTFHSNIGGGSSDRTIYEMMILLAEANKIFRSAKLVSETGTVGLQVVSIVIWTHASQNGYKLASESMPATSFLSKFSDYDMGEYCLGIAFVHRKFPSSVLGLAYSASPRISVAGGICQRSNLSAQRKSYNVMVASVQGMSRRLPRATSIVTLSHELGHSFGSGHDPEEIPECFPTDQQGGHYLMSAFAVSGEKPNHLQFSPCSEESIRKLVEAKGTCLTTRVQSDNLCGNAIRDSLEEECDCGDFSQCSTVDKCCVPKGGLNGDKECHLRRAAGVACSPRSHSCCSEECQLVDQPTECQKETECTEASWCTKKSSQCPEPKPKADGMTCRKGQGKCRKGICEDTWCWGYNLQDCECPDPSLWCVVCCSIQGICASSSHFGIVNESSGGDLMHSDGEPCGGGRGVCNQRRCRMVALDNEPDHTVLPPSTKPNNLAPTKLQDLDISDVDVSVSGTFHISWKVLLIFHAVLLLLMVVILISWYCLPLSSWLRTPRSPPRLPIANSFLVIAPDSKADASIKNKPMMKT